MSKPKITKPSKKYLKELYSEVFESHDEKTARYEAMEVYLNRRPHISLMRELIAYKGSYFILQENNRALLKRTNQLYDHIKELEKGLAKQDRPQLPKLPKFALDT